MFSFFRKKDGNTISAKSRNKLFIIVATVVAQLDVILVEAKNLSLTAKNARVVAIRAGQAALGFKSITNFIDEFSARTIKNYTRYS